AKAAVAQTRPAPVIKIVLPIDHMVTPQTPARLLSTKSFPTAPRWVPGRKLFCPTVVIRAAAKGLLAALLSGASPNRCSYCDQGAARTNLRPEGLSYRSVARLFEPKLQVSRALQ